ncbi:zinc finger MYM-type protein 1-like [Aphis craccivora]|uniref:Zinc finger MYM-type protein 1-like n=1 Tax=Aphis craccivora TaxID=307492 RepID=A0A6G0Y941_APHCR|nr:zinc finger MYM-type protein 1-like [Aphis craccivora]
MLKIFVIIPMASCSCERTFSKLSLIKTNVRSTIYPNQLTVSFEQKLDYNINIDDVIE